MSKKENKLSLSIEDGSKEESRRSNLKNIRELHIAWKQCGCNKINHAGLRKEEWGAKKSMGVRRNYANAADNTVPMTSQTLLPVPTVNLIGRQTSVVPH